MDPATIDAAVDNILATNPRFAVGTAMIRGVEQRVFTNIPSTTVDLLLGAKHLNEDPAQDYIVFGTERISFAAFLESVRVLSWRLIDILKVTPGQHIALAMRNCPEFMQVLLAVNAAGAVPVLLNGWWTAGELGYAIEDSGTSIVFADGERVRRISESGAMPQIIGVRDGEDLTQGLSTLMSARVVEGWPEQSRHTDDDFAIFYSSGTTGQPKGVALTHRGAITAVYIAEMLAEIAKVISPLPDGSVTRRPSFLVATPLFHVTATQPVFLRSLVTGAKLTILEKWNADEAVTLIDQEKVTRFIGVPTQTADIVAAKVRTGASLSTLTSIVSGGAKRPAAQVAELARNFPGVQIGTGWGMTETNSNGIAFSGQEYLDNPGAAGRINPPVHQIRLVDDAGRDVPLGEIGEIIVKSPCVMRGYLNKPEETDAVLRDGWLWSGDLATMDPNGLISIVDRKKDLIIRGGENIACLEVEAAIHLHPGVEEACVFSVPHPRLGEVVGAGVRVKPDVTLSADDLKAFLKGRIADFKCPEYVWLYPGPLPRGTTDKLDRRALRRAFLETHAIKEDAS